MPKETEPQIHHHVSNDAKILNHVWILFQEAYTQTHDKPMHKATRPSTSQSKQTQNAIYMLSSSTSLKPSSCLILCPFASVTCSQAIGL